MTADLKKKCIPSDREKPMVVTKSGRGHEGKIPRTTPLKALPSSGHPSGVA